MSIAIRVTAALGLSATLMPLDTGTGLIKVLVMLR